jgi:hypothetical protein
VAIIVPARDDVPVQVRYQITQTGEIDFIWREQLAQGALNSDDDMQ